MKLFTVGLFVAGTIASCEDGTGWCNFGELDAYYSCDEEAVAFDPNCLKSRIAAKGERTKYIELAYETPAYRDGNADYVEFVVGADKPSMASELTADFAMFQLAAPLFVQDNVDPVVYLGVMQAIAFNEIKSASIEIPEIPGRGKVDVCWGEMESTGVCKEKTFSAGTFKFSFALVQPDTTKCNNPTNCFFFLRATMDLSKTGLSLDDVYFNNDSANTASSKTFFGEGRVLSSLHLKDEVITFPTGVNVNNQEWVKNGCTVHLEEATGADMVMHLAFKVSAPGPGKFLMYDPTVMSASAFDAVFSGASLPSVASLWSIVALAAALTFA
jgi:hypothetical protein